MVIVPKAELLTGRADRQITVVPVDVIVTCPGMIAPLTVTEGRWQ